HPRARRAAAHRDVPGIDVKTRPRPAGPLLDELAGAAGYILVAPDPRVDDTAVPEPPEMHGEIGVLAVHPDREPAGDDGGSTPEHRERARDDDDAVDQALRQPGKPELEQHLEGSQAVEPGRRVRPGLLHGAHHAD